MRGLRKILEGMPGVGSYVDDIVIYSDSWEDHIKTLKELFGRLRKARITARPTKCLLGASRMEFLGHQVGGDVITPSRDNLEKVRNTPRPTTKKQVRSFLGLVGYYRDHTPAFAEIYAPDRPQALEVPKGRVVPERPSVPVGRSGTTVLL